MCRRVLLARGIIIKMSSKIRNLIILGPQGSGKGTQAALLVEQFGFVFLGAGDALRELAKENSELGRRTHQTINVEGRLMEPEVIAEVIERKIKSLPKDQKIIIEGFPRNLRQYELLKNFWPQLGRGDFEVVYLDLAKAEALKRLSKRLVCASCGEIYIAGTIGLCKKCGGQLVSRADDHPEAIQKRLEIFYTDTLPLVQKMEGEGRVIRIDGRPSIEAVHEEIIRRLGVG